MCTFTREPCSAVESTNDFVVFAVVLLKSLSKMAPHACGYMVCLFTSHECIVLYNVNVGGNEWSYLWS